MVSKDPEYRAGTEDVPELDEGWWSAVLADEATQGGDQEEPARESGSPIIVNWDFIRGVYDRDEVIEMRVHGFNRGGLLVQGQNVQGFVPVSHLVDLSSSLSEEERQKSLAAYVGHSLNLKVIECEPSQERVVFSERAALAGEGRRKQIFQSLQPNSIVQGTVTNVTDFGAFIDLGGVEGLIHVSELSWGRVSHPTEILRVGQRVQALVLQVCEENARVALSLKRLTPNPWENLVKRYKPGDVINASVTEILHFGAFARLEEGVEGLIHVSSINFPPDNKDISRLLHPGQAVQVRILHIDVERRRLGLGLVNLE